MASEVVRRLVIDDHPVVGERLREPRSDRGRD
jgi:hypothetical protein